MGLYEERVTCAKEGCNALAEKGWNVCQEHNLLRNKEA